MTQAELIRSRLRSKEEDMSQIIIQLQEEIKQLKSNTEKLRRQQDEFHKFMANGIGTWD